MICPYNIQEETIVQHWQETPDSEETLKNGTTFTRTYYKYGKCKRKKCGAFRKGKCRYKPKD